jgi:hypothetical protein
MDTPHQKRLDTLLRHIHNVQSNCQLLADRLIEKGEADFAKTLIANGLIHDNSKFYGIEWEYLHQDVKESNPEAFLLASKQHVSINPHHPEYWLHISNVPRIYVAEMICDWSARSSEFGSDLRVWIKDKATKKFDFTVQSKTYKEVKEFVDLMLDPSFK